MEIAIIADDAKKELLTQFCIAYCGILSKHNICSTGITGKYVADATGLQIERLLSGKQGGVQQITSRIQYNEIDVVLYQLLRMCDLHNIPVATNIATAEVIICALDKGDLDWREIVNPKSEYNRRKRQNSF